MVRNIVAQFIEELLIEKLLIEKMLIEKMLLLCVIISSTVVSESVNTLCNIIFSCFESEGCRAPALPEGCPTQARPSALPGGDQIPPVLHNARPEGVRVRPDSRTGCECMDGPLG